MIITTSMNGNSSVLKRCSPAALGLWVFVVIAALNLNARIRASFVKPVNPKPAVPVGSKAPSSGLPKALLQSLSYWYAKLTISGLVA
ncbi:hypothetical protein AB7W40_22225 [Providencia rettgeri]